MIGINDINGSSRNNSAGQLTSEDLIAAYRQLIERAHMYGIKVIGGTITPAEGLPQPQAFEKGEAIRKGINEWIRTSKAFDAVVDFDAAVLDPDRPIRIRPSMDPGDHIHPNDEGNQAMVNAPTPPVRTTVGERPQRGSEWKAGPPRRMKVSGENKVIENKITFWCFKAAYSNQC